jgi:alkylation response protein AidB-like acyl-CoA dehydrogenase
MEATEELGPLAAFLVPLDTPGVSIDGQYRTLGVHSCSTGQLSLDAGLPGDALLGGRRTSLIYVKRALDGERILAAVQALASCRFALRIAVAFCRQRRVQGRRLMEQSVLRQRLAAACTELWGAEALLESVVAMYAAGQDISRRAAGLKFLSANVARRLVDEVMQCLGGRSYLEHFLVERLWRDARLLRIGGGTDEVMCEIVAAGLDREDDWMSQWLSARDESDWVGASVRWE